MHTRLLSKLLPTFHTKSRTMALFKQVLNPITGQNDWEVHNDVYDYHQEVANAGFGDMLHDSERNRKFYAALRKAIASMHAEGRQAHVLDIGTGTGILAMMAVRAGADSVTACEAFMPMANCAERIVEANGMRDKIRLIKKRSTEVKLGDDMERKANLLVAELLDTELIGEGAIGIYNHAHDNLLTDDAICIPAKALCYAQVVHSPLAAQWNTLKALASTEADVLLKPPKNLQDCKGRADLHDVQLSQLPLHQFRPLTKPVHIFNFDFSSKAPRPTQRSRWLSINTTISGSTDIVFYWWDIEMDLDKEILLSCAPYWAHPDLKALSPNQTERVPLKNVVPWRDHWMQAIYFIPKPLHLAAIDAEFKLSCNHDEYSMWFDAFPADTAETSVERHVCTCNLHTAFPRGRIGQMNQSPRNKRYLQHLEQTINSDSHVLTLGDGCVLGLSTAKLGAATVICFESSRISRNFMASLAKENELTNVQFVKTLDELNETQLRQITHVFAEPYFLTSILPWDNFYFGTLISKLRDKLSPNVKITPHSARIVAVPVEFLDLHKIRMPVGNDCEGFDLSLFDEMVHISTALTQDKIEAQPLWEYPCIALAQPQKVLEVVFQHYDAASADNGSAIIECPGSCNGIALWVDWNIDGEAKRNSIVSTGPTAIMPGDHIQWDMFVRQGVLLLDTPQLVEAGDSSMSWEVNFEPKTGDIKFTFAVNATQL